MNMQSMAVDPVFSPAVGTAGVTGMATQYGFATTSLGLIVVAAVRGRVRAVLFGSSKARLLADLRSRFPGVEFVHEDESQRQLTERVGQFVDDPGADWPAELELKGTEFEKRVWESLRDIAPGSIASYSEIAKTIGHPGAAQEVAAACARNPIAVIVPCHRVVRKDGSLAGYRWGVERKGQLLEREKAVTQPQNRISLIHNGQLLLPLFDWEKEGEISRGLDS
jgi:AraC family transcriptional regulator of adaptative response/methylated-DNA-[protein]-cysteine methyltransferase